jgi:hypothetical protein
MRVRSRRVAVALLVVGVALVAGPVAAAVAQAAAGSTLDVFDVTADATGIGASFGDPGTQPYPTAAGLAPSATAQLGDGPAGHALASVVWPGPLHGNAGTLANLLGTPLPPDVASDANDPVRAEATASGGARDAQALGPMSAVVDGAQSTATTALTDFSQPSVVSAARVVTTSRSFLDGGTATGIAETQLQGVEVAGLVKIDTIRTVAKGTTDGDAATTDQDVVISGVTVQGQGATIDGKGIHLGPQSTPSPLDPAVAGANQALQAMGMQVFVTAPVEQTGTGGAGIVRSGSVVVVWVPPNSGQTFTVVLGGASVQVRGTSGSTSDLGLGGGSFVPSTGGASGFTGGGDLGPIAAPSGVDVAAGRSTATGAPAATVTPFRLADAGRPSDRVPLGWMLIGLVGMACVGTGLTGLRSRALDGALAGTACPLERGAP